MQILRDINNHIFTPHDSLENWLRTHKRPYAIASMQLPGLFNSDKYTFHLIMFLLALTIEVTGALVLALPFGASLGMIGAVIGSVGFIMDFGIAFILLFPNSNLCYFNNLRILYSSDDGAVAAIDNKIKAIERLKNLGYFIILVVAGIKIYFLKEGFGVVEMPVYVMSFLFLVAAAIHIKYTEHFFAFYVKFFLSANQERNANLHVGGHAAVPQEIFTTTKLIQFTAIPNKCPHSIVPSEEEVQVKLSTDVEEKRFKSILNVTGLITDNDVEILCKSQPSEAARRDIVIELLYLQLNNVTPTNNLQQFVASLPIHRQLIKHQ